MTKADGSVWFKWVVAAGYWDQIETSDELSNWVEAGFPIYGFGQETEIKLLDAPAGGGNQGGGGNGGGGGNPPSAVQNLDAMVNVFPNGKVLLSFIADAEPQKVLLDIDFTSMLTRMVPIYAKYFDRPDPQIDCRVMLFFQSRAWHDNFLNYSLSGLTLSQDASDTVTAFSDLASSILADLTAPPNPENEVVQGAALVIGAQKYIRVSRTNADLDVDGIADAWESNAIGWLAGSFFNPFSWDTDGDGVPDLVEAVAKLGESKKPGEGDETDPNDEPFLAFFPPNFVVYPLGGEFILGSASESFQRAWITDLSTVGAIKKLGPLATDVQHLVWKDQVATELWPKEPQEYPKGTIIDVSRSGKFLMDVTCDEGEQVYRVVSENDILALTGITLEADMSDKEIMDLPYYKAKKTQYSMGGAVVVNAPITKSIESVSHISEWGNVVGIIRINVVFEMENPEEVQSYVVNPAFSMLLPYFWKTGTAPGGENGSIHEYFQADGSNRYWTEIPNPPASQNIANEPNFELNYFGGLDTLVYTTGGSKKIGIVWPGVGIPQYDIEPGYNPHDGNSYGATVSAKSSVQTRDLSDSYEDSLFISPDEDGDGDGDGEELTNNNWWNLANVTRTGDPVNKISAINGSAFVVKASNGEGAVVWQAWGLKELVANAGGETPIWSDLNPLHIANTGAVVSECKRVATGLKELSLLLPVEIEIKHTEKERDDEGNELATAINPGATTLLRDEIADLRIKVPTLGTTDWDMKLELEPADMKTESLDTRGSVRMSDFGTIDPFGTITPLSANGNGTTKAGPYDIKLLAGNGGDETFRIVVNKEGKFKLRLKSADNKIDVLSQEFTVTKRIRKYARRPENNSADFDKHDKAFVDAAEAWGSLYNNPLDPDILKAMGIQESTLGYGATPTADILTINYGGNDQDHVLAILHKEHTTNEKEAIPDGDNGWTIRWLDYDDAAAGSARVAIHWGTCWLFHKAQKGRFVSAPNSPPHYVTFGGWNTWETAVGYYGPNPVYLGVIEGPWKRGRRDSTTGKVGGVWKKIDFAESNFQYLWPILTNHRPRK